MRMGPGEVWRATRTPDGPATTRITATTPGELTMQAWGPGADWAVDAFPALVGQDDDDSGFEPRDPTVAELRRDRKSTRLNSSHIQKSRMPSSA